MSTDAIDAPVETVATKPRRTKKPKPVVRDTREFRRVADLLKQSADATRLQVLLLLREKDLNVTELCVELDNMTQPAVSHHLALLRHGRLITPQRSGKNNFYGLTSEGRALADVVAGLVD